ncbi:MULTISPECIES: hypothetical protein [Streptomyces]|uniref:Integral membrane protein n=2 Tax=Streptomyces TaxID=1883 RepID=A0ABS9JA79_9ACTN|nr:MULTISPECIES: hypothetical protein [Streptomyces]AKN70134.1 membrane protein [Streptomyces sp. PBH53]MCG0062468.1 hypothetical protein [Streptomyces tricolor]BCM65800.1 hypothetical protein EASAB2608_01134 [Streptomyces sp. EAS-AB2608]CUW27400.1 hypothetical protein TUE45_02124 [Streptomyces reticuli]
MDHANRFETRTTYGLLRLEYGVALVVCSVLFLLHLSEVRWWPAVLLFVYIDLIGYIPGAIAYRRARGGDISKVYYVLYNTMHSMVTNAVVVGVWALVAGFEWALLAVPIHLCGDRALFGNFLKPFAVRFEPVRLPAFEEFERRLAERDRSGMRQPEHV